MNLNPWGAAFRTRIRCTGGGSCPEPIRYVDTMRSGAAYCERHMSEVARDAALMAAAEVTA